MLLSPWGLGLHRGTGTLWHSKIIPKLHSLLSKAIHFSTVVYINRWHVCAC